MDTPNRPNPQENCGTLPDEIEQQSIIRRAIKGRRHIIAARMSKILRSKITPGKLAELLRKDGHGKRHTRMPLSWLRAFCEAVGSDDLALAAAPDSTRRVTASRKRILESREAVTRAQEALSALQTELSQLAEGKPHGAKDSTR